MGNDQGGALDAKTVRGHKLTPRRLPRATVYVGDALSRLYLVLGGSV